MTWVREYNADAAAPGARDRARRSRRPSASSPRRDEQRELLALWLPGALSAVAEPARTRDRRARRRRRRGAGGRRAGGPVEFDRVVPPSGNLWVARRQFWLGPARAGQTVRFWASVDVIHLSIAGARVKSLRSHLSTADLAQLATRGRDSGRPAAAADRRARDGGAIEVDRAVNNTGLVGLAGQPDARRRDPRAAGP